MKKSILVIGFLAFSSLALAQGTKDAAQVIDLKDGGKVVLMKDGSMAHYDAGGNRIKMKDGHEMQAKDGSKVMMKNNAIWKTVTEHGTLKPGH